MTESTPIWDVERSLWTGGRLAFATHMAADCLVAIPGSGVMAAERVLDRVDSVPRWPDVKMTVCQLHQGQTTVVLGYEAHARRPGQDYAALCTSTYRLTGGLWKLIQHQQGSI